MTTTDSVLDDLVAVALAEVDAALMESRRPVLMFSGGKDSLACLYLLRAYWDRLAVVWANPGDPYPETLAQMEGVRQLVHEFHEVRGNSLADSMTNGYPSDMIPMAATEFGRANVRSSDTFLVQASFACCMRNFWEPAHAFTEQLGADLIVRGERDAEAKRSPIRSGALDHLGRRVLQPVEKWARQEVFAYLDREGVEVPRSYAFGLPSLDCMRCTAYLDESANKLAYLRRFHPTVAPDFEARLRLVAKAQAREFRFTQIALGEVAGHQGEGLAD